MIKAKATFRWEVNPIPIMEGLRDSTKSRILKKAMRQAILPMRDDLKQTAPRRFGFLRQSMAVKIVAYKGGVNVVGMAGAKSKFKRVKNNITYLPSKYFHLVDRDTKHAQGKNFTGNTWNRKKRLCGLILIRVVREEMAKKLAKGKR